MACQNTDHNTDVQPTPNPFGSNFIALSSTRVVDRQQQILVVAHDHDGNWQLLHGNLTSEDKIAQICIQCAIARDPSLVELADLPTGWIATRKSRHKQWKRSPLEKPKDPIWVRFFYAFYKRLGTSAHGLLI
jgi:hypothetical protein